MDLVDLKYWTSGQILDFVREIHKDVGAGWELLVPRLRRALVHEKVLSIHLTNQGRLNREAIIELRAALLQEAGLDES
jgi:hypothetical protein